MITRLNIMLAVLVLSLTGGAVGIKGTDGYTASIGNAVALDGSTEYLTDGVAGLIDGPEYTFTAWVNTRIIPSSWDNQRGIVGDYAGTAFCSLIISGDGTTITPCYSWYNGSGSTLVFGQTIQTNQWYLLVVTHKQGFGVVGSVNALAYTTNTSSTAAAKMTDAVRIGYNDYNAQRKWNGLLDEVSIWTRILTHGEISELYNNGNGKRVDQLSTGTNGLIRLWHLDESGSAANAYDSASGTTATGTAIGTGNWVTGIVPLKARPQ